MEGLGRKYGYPGGYEEYGIHDDRAVPYPVVYAWDAETLKS